MALNHLHLFTFFLKNMLDIIIAPYVTPEERTTAQIIWIPPPPPLPSLSTTFMHFMVLMNLEVIKRSYWRVADKKLQLHIIWAICHLLSCKCMQTYTETLFKQLCEHEHLMWIEWCDWTLGLCKSSKECFAFFQGSSEAFS